jgi:hypothetical protein
LTSKRTSKLEIWFIALKKTKHDLNIQFFVLHFNRKLSVFYLSKTTPAWIDYTKTKRNDYHKLTTYLLTGTNPLPALSQNSACLKSYRTKISLKTIHSTSFVKKFPSFIPKNDSSQIKTEKTLQQPTTFHSTLNRKSSASFISKRLLPRERIKKQRETISEPTFCCKQTTSYHLTKTPHFCLNSFN